MNAESKNERGLLILLIIEISLALVGNFRLSLKCRFLAAALTLVHVSLTIPVLFILTQLEAYRTRIEDKASTNESFEFESPTSWNLKLVPVSADIGELSKAYKTKLNSLSRDEFNAAKFYGVSEGPRNLGDPSRGSHKFREILRAFQVHGVNLSGLDFFDACAGSGGWSAEMVRMGSTGTALSFWSPQHAQWDGPENVNRIKRDFIGFKPIRTELFLFDGGESDKRLEVEQTKFRRLFEQVTEWIRFNPKAHFVIKVLTPGDYLIRLRLAEMQKITGKGRLIRLNSSRLSTAEMYFVSLPIQDIDTTVAAFYRRLTPSLTTPKEGGKTMEYANQEVVWPEKGNYGVTELAEYDMSSSIDEVAYERRPPRNITKFLKEITYFQGTTKGSDTTIKNPYVQTLLGALNTRLPGLRSWKTTSTTPHSTFRMVTQKIDKAPVEQHQYWEHLGIVYDVVADYIRRKGGKLRRLDDDSVIKNLNPKGAMGMQEDIIEDPYGNKHKFNSIKEYATFKVGNRYLWKSRIKRFRESLKSGKPIWSVFNSIGKKEKKVDASRYHDKGSRLIWYLPATPRIFETQVFGSLEQDILGVLPYSVSGVPLYDYGEVLSDLMKDGYKAIANDVAGWDTRISYGIQCLEADFLKKLTKDETLKEDIELLYRLYANAHVAIDRSIENIPETAIYKLRGQVASGRRPTYAMNTITNIVVTMLATAVSQGVEIKDLAKWIKRRLDQGHSSMYGGKISGDDSVLVFGPDEAVKFAKYGHEVLNALGLYRKNMDLEAESRIIDRMEDIEFCSNNYTQVSFRKGMETWVRWMPIRTFEEIVAKASISIMAPKDDITGAAWARAQGYNLLINYGHMHEVKALALSILSSTDPNIQLQSLELGWQLQHQPWMRSGDVLDIYNSCLFGDSTTIQRIRESGFKIDSLRFTGHMFSHERRRYLNLNSKHRKDWYQELPTLVQVLRDRKPQTEFHDWNQYMRSINFEDQYM